MQSTRNLFDGIKSVVNEIKFYISWIHAYDDDQKFT